LAIVLLSLLRVFLLLFVAGTDDELGWFDVDADAETETGIGEALMDLDRCNCLLVATMRGEGGVFGA